MKNTIKYLFAIFMVSSLNYAFAQNGISPKSIYMYKNGYAWVVSSGKVTVKNGQWWLSESQIPKYSMGSFWFQSPAGINMVKRQNDTVLANVFQPTVGELLKLNKGKKVKLICNNILNSMTIEGTISQIFEIPQDSAVPFRVNPAVAIIKTSTGNVVIYEETLAKIMSAEFGDDASYLVRKKKIESKLTVYFKEKPATTDLTVVGLQQYPAWNPVYRLVLDDNNKAKLTLGAEVSSNNTDFSNAELNLVVGNPSFSYGDILSRLVENSTPISEQPNYRYNDVMEKSGSGMAEGKFAPGASNVSISAGNSEDFYFYTVKNFSLQKNQSALVQIIQENVDVTHQYRCDLSAVNMYIQPYIFASFDEASIVPVNHFIQFKNPAKQPLTAAPIFIEKVSGANDIAQAQTNMDIVPIGGVANIFMATNMDLPVKQIEEETNRIASAKIIANKTESVSYDLITVKAKMHLENQSDKEKTITLKRSIEGKPLTTELPWTLKSLPSTNANPNSPNNITWEVKLKPGEKKDFTYTYEYYLRIY